MAITRNISEIDVRAVSETARPVRDTSTQAAIEGVQSILGTAGAVQDEFTKTGLREEMAGIADQEAAGTAELQSLTEQAVDPANKLKVDELTARIRTLEKGEAAGAITSSAAGTLKSTARKQFIQAHPHLTTEANQIYQAYKTPAAAGGTRTPEQEAFDQVRESAALNGISVSKQMEANSLSFTREQKKAELDAAIVTGTVTMPQVQAGFTADVQNQTSQLMAEIRNEVRANPGTVDSTAFADKIAVLQMKLYRDAANIGAKAAGMNVQFSPAAQKSLEATVNRELTSLQLFIDSKDKMKFLARQEESAKYNNLTIFRNSMPFVATLKDSLGNEAASTYMYTVLPAVTAAISKNGNEDALRLSAENGDPNAIKAVNLIDGVGLGQLYQNIQNQKPYDAQDAESAYTNLFGGQFINTPLEEKTPEVDSFLTNIVQSLTADDVPAKEMKWFDSAQAELNMTTKGKVKLGRKVNQSEVTIRQFFGKRTSEKSPKIVLTNGHWRIHQYNSALNRFQVHSPSQASESRDVIDALDLISKLNRRYEFNTPSWEQDLINDLNQVHIPAEKVDPDTVQPTDSIHTEEEYQILLKKLQELEGG